MSSPLISEEDTGPANSSAAIDGGATDALATSDKASKQHAKNTKALNNTTDQLNKATQKHKSLKSKLSQAQSKNSDENDNSSQIQRLESKIKKSTKKIAKLAQKRKRQQKTFEGSQEAQKIANQAKKALIDRVRTTKELGSNISDHQIESGLRNNQRLKFNEKTAEGGSTQSQSQDNITITGKDGTTRDFSLTETAKSTGDNVLKTYKDESGDIIRVTEDKNGEVLRATSYTKDNPLSNGIGIDLKGDTFAKGENADLKGSNENLLSENRNIATFGDTSQNLEKQLAELKIPETQLNETAKHILNNEETHPRMSMSETLDHIQETLSSSPIPLPAANAALDSLQAAKTSIESGQASELASTVQDAVASATTKTEENILSHVESARLSQRVKSDIAESLENIKINSFDDVSAQLDSKAATTLEEGNNNTDNVTYYPLEAALKGALESSSSIPLPTNTLMNVTSSAYDFLQSGQASKLANTAQDAVASATTGVSDFIKTQQQQQQFLEDFNGVSEGIQSVGNSVQGVTQRIVEFHTNTLKRLMNNQNP